MDNIQINGQRRWGPPYDWTGPPPPHGTEIFIKNLAEDVFEEEIFRIFSFAGRIFEVRLPVHWSGENRGYAFVRYTKVEEADKAIEKFRRFQIRPGKPMEVERSVDNTRLFLSAVQKEKSADDIGRDLSEYVENVKKVYVYPTEDKNFYRGYAFVEFETHRDAAIAKRILTPDICSSVFEKKCIAAWANPLPFLDQNVRKNLSVLFMRNIPKDMKSFELKKELKDILGADEICKIKRLNDFAFLTFKDHDEAEMALKILKGKSRFASGYEIDVEWAVPREIASCSRLRQGSRQEETDRSPNFEPEKSPIRSIASTLRSGSLDFPKEMKKSPGRAILPNDGRPLGPLVVSVPDGIPENFRMAGARPIRGLSCCSASPSKNSLDSDDEPSSLSPQSACYSDRSVPITVSGLYINEVNPFTYGVNHIFGLP